MTSKQLASNIRTSLEGAGLDVYVAAPFPKEVVVLSTTILPEATRDVLRQLAAASGIDINVRQSMSTTEPPRPWRASRAA